ncbi:MAG: carboxypeptidase-like regulatory domain-containing protein [Halomonas sp.]|uniref:carboxypeptidase-like regulatory domain-containing protein n=1 Tax=Halomonas sp. TaxID=1486246 RepID=UPI002ACE0AA7|nr:carboxypeptidase-like regulatory domain-containing protein [Halomonas sp.]MDZ7853084.1 carboxypeptidase-like regulatory domain-containing protein [Halomonas sp.]
MKPWIVPALLGLSLTGCQIIEPRYPAGERERVEVIERGTEVPQEVRETEPPERAERPSTTGRVSRQVGFSAEEYAALEKSGNATISGKLTIGGRPVSNAGVSVAPVTTYSAEAASQALAGRAVEPADPRARAYTHTTRTDGNGNFRLSGLPAGEFYVSGSGRDPSTGETRVVIRQISLSNGQALSIDLSR